MKENADSRLQKANSKKGKTIKEKVQRHLRDKNDVITEQDLKEVIVGVDAVDLNHPDEPSILSEDIPTKKIVTPWDVVDNKE